MHFDRWLGLDIGGANIKVAILPSPCQIHAESKSIPFALWKHPEKLKLTLGELFASYNNPKLGIAVTMTGELADGYPSRQAGVESIVDAVVFACESYARGEHEVGSTAGEILIQARPVFYGIGPSNAESAKRGHHWHDAESAKSNWNRVAAANWHAIASCLQHLPGLEPALNGFLIDIGSTTTDIIPIRSGLPAASGLTDLTRLQSCELFYAGVARTPICSLVQGLIIAQRPILIAREFFATVEDCFIVSGDIAQDEERLDTADGRPATRACAGQRIAKMVCADAWLGSNEDRTQSDPQNSFLSLDEIFLIAQQVISALHAGISDSIQHVIDHNQDLPKRFFLTGQGDWFARRILTEQFGSDTELYIIGDIVGKPNSQSMAAFAVASLASRELSCSVPTGSGPPEYWSSRLSAPSTVSKTDKPERIRVIKIGGSLLSNPNNPERIQRWLKGQPEDCKNLWFVGGGTMVDQIRDFHAKFQLSDSASHWLALGAMSLNLQLVQHWFPDWPMIDNCEAVKQQFQRPGNENLLFDFGQWLKRRPPNAKQLPESWQITSDSCAAFLAEQIGACELVLLKSCYINPGRSLEELAQSKIVDACFPKYASRVRRVQMVNLNSDNLA